jgi:hypothetical protein
MAIITVPSTMLFALGSGITQRTYGASGDSTITGSMQYVMTGEPRWVLTIAAPKLMRAAEAGQWRAMLLSLRGRVNHLSCWDPSRQAPAGSARGAMSVGAGAAKGATTVNISGGNGTLLRGDWLQIGAMALGTYQLVSIVADTTVPGPVSIEPPLRQAVAGGAAVTWDKARALFKLGASDLPEFLAGASAGQIQGFKVQLLEQWS